MRKRRDAALWMMRSHDILQRRASRLDGIDPNSVRRGHPSRCQAGNLPRGDCAKGRKEMRENAGKRCRFSCRDGTDGSQNANLGQTRRGSVRQVWPSGPQGPLGAAAFTGHPAHGQPAKLLRARQDGARLQHNVASAEGLGRDPRILWFQERAAPARRLHWHKEGDRAERRTCGLGGSWRRVLCNIQLGVDGKTPEIRAAGAISGDVGDAPVLSELRDQVDPEQENATLRSSRSKPALPDTGKGNLRPSPCMRDCAPLLSNLPLRKARYMAAPRCTHGPLLSDACERSTFIPVIWQNDHFWQQIINQFGPILGLM